MSEFTIAELREAEIVPEQGGPNAWLVRFGESDYRMVPRTPKHRLLLETDLLERAEGGDTKVLDRDDGAQDHVTFTADVDSDSYHLTVNGNRLKVPSDFENEVLEAYADEDFAELRRVHQDIVENRVRVGLMDRFMPRFADARDDNRLRKAGDGWVIDDTFIVQWNGENYLTEQVGTHIVESGEAVRADEEHPAREITFDIPDDEVEVDVPNTVDATVTLSAREARFLATAECLLNPQEYLTDVEADWVEDAVESVQDPIASLARTAQVSGFTDEKSGLYHGHGLQKHTLSDLGVTDEAIDMLHYNSFDHTGVWEMAVREQEFKNAPFNVFEDAANDDSSKWQKIRNTKDKAPIPSDVKQSLQQMYT